MDVTLLMSFSPYEWTERYSISHLMFHQPSIKVQLPEPTKAPSLSIALMSLYKASRDASCVESKLQLSDAILLVDEVL